ncbi:MAG: ACP S-malonyltransferase [Thermoleophilia bacterium]|nr:ACP S-malonyltransferase [Thermoleophilia bacterium]
MGKLALVFPGQGSQAVGMGVEMALKYESAAEVYQRADRSLGWNISDLSFSGPAEKLNLTENAQPALYVNSLAAMAVLREKGIRADVVSGHSLGEYSALAAAGAVGFEEGLKLVRRRGEIMGRTAAERPGSMAAILGLEDRQVEEICSRTGRVWPVNYNSPGQLVVSGEAEAVQAAMQAAEDAGARKTVRLAVGGSFHSPLMQAASEEMEELLKETRFAEPAPPFLSSISCGYEGAAALAGLLTRQIVAPVRWRQAVEKLVADGVDRFIEAGSGKVLCGLIKRISPDVAAVNVSDEASLKKAMATV